MKKILVLLFSVSVFILSGCSQDSGKEASANDESGNYPEKSIEMMIPFAAGGVTDSVARIVAEGAQRHLPNNQKIVPINTPGAGGKLGMTKHLNDDPDGYKIAFTNTDAISVVSTFSGADYSTDSFQPIVKVLSSPWVLAVRSDSPWKTFEDFIEYAKENPGKFTYGTPFVGSPPQIVMDSLKITEGIETKNITYDGSNILPNLLGGNIDAYTGSPRSVTPYYESGEVNVLANFSDTVIKGFEDVPTLKDLGYDISMPLVFGIVGPEGMNEETQKVLHDAFKKAMEDPKIIERIESVNINPAYGPAEELQQDFNDVAKMYEDVLSALDKTK